MGGYAEGEDPGGRGHTFVSGKYVHGGIGPRPYYTAQHLKISAASVLCAAPTDVFGHKFYLELSLDIK